MDLILGYNTVIGNQVVTPIMHCGVAGNRAAIMAGLRSVLCMGFYPDPDPR
jgi:hypothetical protein